MRKLLFLGAALMSFSFPAYAEEFVYAPPLCPLAITFPETPDIRTVCADAKTCHDVVTFRHIQDLTTYFSLKISCEIDTSKSLPADHVMAQSLQILMTDTHVREHTAEVRTHDKGRIKQAVFLAQREEDGVPAHAVGQLWMGKGWRYTVLAESHGSEGMDAPFFTVLDSLRLTSSKP